MFLPRNASTSEAIQKYFGYKGKILQHSDIPIRIDYSQSYSIDIDRLVATYATYCIYGSPAVIIDLGTATTINVLSRDAICKGGAICPGLGTAKDALFEKTECLNPVNCEETEIIIGKNTKENLQIGILGGHTLMLKGFVKEYVSFMQENESSVKVIVTGGWAGVIGRMLPTTYIIDQNLIIKGIALLTITKQFSKDNDEKIFPSQHKD